VHREHRVNQYRPGPVYSRVGRFKEEGISDSLIDATPSFISIATFIAEMDSLPIRAKLAPNAAIWDSKPDISEGIALQITKSIALVVVISAQRDCPVPVDCGCVP
jgi:hypothetical protein